MSTAYSGVLRRAREQIVANAWMQLTLILAAAILARLALFEAVGVYADAGFYIYDARLILDGQVPFYDFLGRSPVFIYAYAAAAWVFGNSIVTLRAFIMSVWLLTAVPVYLIGREIRGHRVGLLAAAIFLFSPFTLVYGFWSNTMSVAALFGTVAIWLLVREQSWQSFAAAGMLFGLAFLSRRSVIVLLFAGILYAGAVWWFDGRSGHSRVVARAASVMTGFAAVLACGYLLLAGGSLTEAYALFEIHSVNLLVTYGRGGFPLLGVDAPLVTNAVDSGRIPVFNALCQVCGAWTARVLAKVTVLLAPVLGIGAVYVRYGTGTWLADWSRPYFAAILIAAGVFGSYSALMSGFGLRVLTIVGLGLFIVVAFRMNPSRPSWLLDRQTVLLVLVLAGLFGGYLYRNRLLHTYYFMDFIAAGAVLAALLFAHAWTQSGQRLRVVLVVAVLLTSVPAFATAYPLTNIVLEDNDAGWQTVDSVEAYEQDMNARTEPGETVLVGSPLYVAQSHVTMVNDNPRIHLIGARYQDNGPAEPMYESILTGLEDGSIEYVVMDRLTAELLLWNGTATTEFREHYCEVDSELYDQTNATLFKRGDCGQAPHPRRWASG